MGLLVTFVELIKNPRYNFWATDSRGAQKSNDCSNPLREVASSPPTKVAKEQQDGVAI